MRSSTAVVRSEPEYFVGSGESVADSRSESKAKEERSKVSMGEREEELERAMHSRNPLKLIAISSFICPLMNRGCFIIRLSTVGASERVNSVSLSRYSIKPCMDPSGYDKSLALAALAIHSRGHQGRSKNIAWSSLAAAYR